MTNEQGSAMSKLPTAYQTLNHHLSRVGLTLTTAHESILMDAIESHTAAHTAALRERVKELEAENARYRERIGEALKFLQSRQQTTPGLGAPITILKQALEK